MRTNNPLRDLIEAGKPTIGTHAHVIWGGMVEAIGHSGTMDYIEFSGQYAPYDLFALENFGRAVDLFPHMSAMMKLDQEPRTYLAERAIGSGIPNMLFADLRTVEDAREAVAAMKPETPEHGGIKGLAVSRYAGYLLTATSLAEHVELLAKSVVAVMIEKPPAVENLEEILSVPGIDMVQFGPADYSISIGVAGQWDHPDVKAAETRTIRTSIEMGIRPRVEIDRWEEAKPYMDLGVIDFCIGSDIAIVHDYCREQGDALAKALGR